jgi:uncharacterized membrane protein
MFSSELTTATAVPKIFDFLKVAALFAAVDFPYLAVVRNQIFEMTRSIQGGRAVSFRLAAAVPVYAAMTALLQLFATSTLTAFLLGLCVYAVYDFTSYALLKDYRLDIAIMDTLWGGSLFAIVYNLKLKLAK